MVSFDQRGKEAAKFISSSVGSRLDHISLHECVKIRGVEAMYATSEPAHRKLVWLSHSSSDGRDI